MVELIISLKLKGFWLSVRKFEALKGLRNSMGTEEAGEFSELGK